MKPAERSKTVTSTLTGERIGMTLDPTAMAHLAGILTDLYSDPELAVLREYSTNAFDAHVDAGINLPIEVALPSTLSPYLKIRDYGNGLDADDIRNIYSLYGASTKRETNDQVGTLGLGCKSALTYTDQFTIQGVKNGVCTQVAVSRDEDGAGTMTIVAEYETEDASGVEISIPVMQRNSFEEKARNFFRFWETGTVLVNGEEPEQITGMEIAEDLIAVGTHTLGKSVVVMGNVPYPFDDPWNRFAVVAYVPIGAVQFTPSREALQMSAKTKAVIEDIIQRVNDGKQGAIERLIEFAANKAEAMAISLRSEDLFQYSGALTYKGEEIPRGLRRIDGAHDFITIRRHDTYSRRRYGSRQIDKTNAIPAGLIPKTLFFTGYMNKTASPTMRKKLLKWFGEWVATQPEGKNFEQVETFVLCADLPHAEWIPAGHVHQWEDVKDTKLEREVSTTGRPTGAYDVRVPGDYMYRTMVADDIDTTTTLMYHDQSYRLDAQAVKVIEDTYPSVTFVRMSSNRIAKFERTFPDAKRAQTAAREIAQAWADTLTDRQKLWLAIHENDNNHRSDYNPIYALDPKRVNDPEVVAMIQIAREKKPRLQAKAAQYQGLVSLEQITSDPTEKYMLLEKVGSYEFVHTMDDEEREAALEHAYAYINAVYAQQKETK